MNKIMAKRFLYYRQNHRDLWTCDGDAREVAAQRNIGYGGVTNGTLRSKNQLLQQQPHAHRVEGF